MNLLLDIEENPVPDIQGLSYIPDFITGGEEHEFISKINSQPWLSDLKRRVQHYGYKYDYTARTVTRDSYLGPLPDWVQPLCKRLFQEQVFSDVPDQVIINEYLPGQGISAHIDCVPCFAETIASVSVGSSVIMQFTQPKTGQKEEIYLKERSLIILAGEARYQWQHAIPARKSDIVNGFKIDRGKRISLTFRKVILETS